MKVLVFSLLVAVFVAALTAAEPEDRRYLRSVPKPTPTFGQFPNLSSGRYPRNVPRPTPTFGQFPNLSSGRYPRNVPRPTPTFGQFPKLSSGGRYKRNHGPTKVVIRPYDAVRVVTIPR